MGADVALADHLPRKRVVSKVLEEGGSGRGRERRREGGREGRRGEA